MKQHGGYWQKATTCGWRREIRGAAARRQSVWERDS
jgi:hypothetical protein